MTHHRTKIILVAIILGLCMLLNIFVAALIFFDIRVVDMPTTTVTIEVYELNPDEAVLHTTITIDNPNPFAVIVQDLHMATKTKKGTPVMNLVVQGGQIQPRENKTFSSNTLFSLHEDLPDQLISEITGIVGVQFFNSITKTIPVRITIIASLGDIVEKLTLPQIHADVTFDEISKHGVNITGILTIDNPNPFDLHVDNLRIDATTDAGIVVGSLIIPDTVITAEQTTTLQGSGSIQLKALDAEYLALQITGNTNIHLLGVTKKIPVSMNVSIKIPHLSDIFALNTPTDMIIKSDMEFKGRGFIDHITLEIINPNNLPLEAKDVTFSIYTVVNDVEDLVGEARIERASVKEKNTTLITTEIPLPLSKLLKPKGGGFLPDALLVTVRAKVTIEGLDQWFWLGVSGYQDIHIFR